MVGPIVGPIKTPFTEKSENYCLWLFPGGSALEQQRKTAKNTQNIKDFPWLQKTKGQQNTKERKIRGEGSGSVRPRFRVRFQAVKGRLSVDSHLETQLTSQPPQSFAKGEAGFGGFPGAVEQVVQAQLTSGGH